MMFDTMTTDQIRKRFLDFFAAKGHKVVKSDTLVPKDDPTVLFTTAGMQQFKRQFLGQPEVYSRAASSQKCLRTDDLEEVGVTPYHHTFFEMLGNFSFGDYFKKEAIEWAWEFLTREMGIPPEKLWVSIYQDDEEAEKIWLDQIGIPRRRLVKLGDESNFWPAEARQKGPNGPCGPCSEIYYDYGFGPGGEGTDTAPGADQTGRFSEVWNLVFTQFNRKDGGELAPLPSKNIDTGMGLERLAAVVQGKHSNFEIDIFAPILEGVKDELNRQKVSVFQTCDLFRYADHVRAVVFGIADGVVPSNKERGSVIKRLITDITDLTVQHKARPFMDKIAMIVVDIMKSAYPELPGKANEIQLYIKKIQDDYEKVFALRLPELRKQLETAKASSSHQQAERIGRIMFEFRDTFGLTLSTIEMTMRQTGIDSGRIRSAGTVFRNLMERQQEQSRASSKMTGEVFTETDIDLENVPKTLFTGYDRFRDEGKILKVFRDGQEADQASEGETVKLILDRTPFYAEAGGQVGDIGTIQGARGRVRIEDTQKTADVFVHLGRIESGSVSVSETVNTFVDSNRRMNIMRNHTATHLLQAGLREILGSHVRQQGSLVAEDRLRFDFTHPRAVTDEELKKIEDCINQRILSDDAVQKDVMPIEEAQKKGALAFFAEKYGEKVRVITIDGYSKEFCGGTHLDSTGRIGLFKIIQESAIAQGIRRLEAVTGAGALQYVNDNLGQIRRIREILKSAPQEVVERVADQSSRIKRLEKEIGLLRLESLRNSLDELIRTSSEKNGTKVICHSYRDIGPELLRKITDEIRQKTASAAIAIGSRCGGNAFLTVSVTEDLIQRGITANGIISKVVPVFEGSGGGRPQMAQAGSRNPARLEDALRKCAEEFDSKI